MQNVSNIQLELHLGTTENTALKYNHSYYWTCFFL